MKELKAKLAQLGIINKLGKLHKQCKRILQQHHPDIIQSIILNTSTIKSQQVDLRLRLKWILHDITEEGKCVVCGQVTTFNHTTNKYRSYCSLQKNNCAMTANSPAKMARDKTIQTRYGVANVMQCKEVQDKHQETILDRYGVKHIGSSPHVKTKALVTKQQKYGDPHYANHTQAKVTKQQKYGDPHYNNHAQAKVTKQQKYGDPNYSNRKKANETMILRHGVPYSMSSDIIHTKMKNTMIARYGTENVNKSKEITDKIKATNLAKYGNASYFGSEYGKQHIKDIIKHKYGVDHILQCPEIKERHRANIATYHLHGSQDHIEHNSLIKLNDKEWMLDQHVNLRKTFTKIAEELGVAHSTVGLYMKRHDIDAEFTSQSQGERDIVEFVKSLGLDTTIETNNRTILSGKEIDIYLPDFKLAIEFNGVYWHGETKGKSRSYHLNKTIWCNKQGIRLVHITDIEWSTKQDIVKSRIRNMLGLSETVYGRKTKIVNIDNKTKKRFLVDNHIQGNCASKINMGLEYNGTLVALMTFGKSRFTKAAEYELLRYVNLAGHSVIGGASKLLKHFIREHSPTSIVSYSDKRWNSGELYSTIGFEFKHSSKPNYFYYINSGTNNVLFSRNSFQKHKLAKKLHTFDPELTEWQNMQANGYDRIWDCGNDVFILTTS